MLADKGGSIQDDTYFFLPLINQYLSLLLIKFFLCVEILIFLCKRLGNLEGILWENCSVSFINNFSDSTNNYLDI